MSSTTSWRNESRLALEPVLIPVILEDVNFQACSEMSCTSTFVEAELRTLQCALRPQCEVGRWMICARSSHDERRCDGDKRIYARDIAKLFERSALRVPGGTDCRIYGLDHCAI
jgi:hypothetical protein